MPAVHIVSTSTLRTESGAGIRERWSGARMHTHTHTEFAFPWKLTTRLLVNYIKLRMLLSKWTIGTTKFPCEILSTEANYSYNIYWNFFSPSRQMSAYLYHLEIGHDRFLPRSFQHIYQPALVEFCVEIWMQAYRTRSRGALLEDYCIIIRNNFVHITGVVLYKNPMCLSLYLSTSTPFLAAYLICVFADQFSYFCLSCRVVLVFFCSSNNWF